MYVIVHTMTIRERDYVVETQYFHALLSGGANSASTTVDSRLVARKVRVKVFNTSLKKGYGRDVGSTGQRRLYEPPSLKKTLMKKGSASVKHSLRTFHIYSRNGGQSVVNTPIVPKVNAALPDAKPQLALTTSNAINSNINHGVEKLHCEQSNNNGNNNNIIREDIILSEQQQSQRVQQQLTSTADPSQAIRWLVANRFERFLASFGNFSGADLLRMSRDDLIQVCGQPDGIRLFNALHSKTIAPALTIYISRNRSSPYHAIYLRSFSTNELQAKLSSVLSLASADCISAIYVQGPQGIHVHLEDTVLRHIRDETMFNVVVLGNNGGSSDGFAVLLKPESNAKGSSSSSFDDRSN